MDILQCLFSFISLIDRFSYWITAIVHHPSPHFRETYFYQVIFGTKFKFSENQSTLRFHYSYWAPSILLRSRRYDCTLFFFKNKKTLCCWACSSATTEFYSRYWQQFFCFLKRTTCNYNNFLHDKLFSTFTLFRLRYQA